MKRLLTAVFLSAILLPLLAGCGEYDYYAHVSDERSDLFLGETESFTLTAACVTREHPFLSDGVTAPLSRSLELVLTEKEPTGGEYEVYLPDEGDAGGEMSFRNVSGDYYYSRNADEFPSRSLRVRVVSGGQSREVVLTSVKSEKTLSPREVLKRAVAAEKEEIGRLTEGKRFRGEFYVRLLHRDAAYYYVGIVQAPGKILSLLLDSETGEVLARHAMS